MRFTVPTSNGSRSRRSRSRPTWPASSAVSRATRPVQCDRPDRRELRQPACGFAVLSDLLADQERRPVHVPAGRHPHPRHDRTASAGSSKPSTASCCSSPTRTSDSRRSRWPRTSTGTSTATPARADAGDPSRGRPSGRPGVSCEGTRCACGHARLARRRRARTRAARCPSGSRSGRAQARPGSRRLRPASTCRVPAGPVTVTTACARGAGWHSDSCAGGRRAQGPAGERHAGHPAASPGDGRPCRRTPRRARRR